MTAHVHFHPGRLPPFWDHGVIFFANLMALFYGNEGATQELAAKVGGLDTYGGRLCPLLNLLFRGESNLLVLESHPNESLLNYFSDELGLELPEIVTLHHSCYEDLSYRLSGAAGRVSSGTEDEIAVARIACHPACRIDGFVTDAVLTAAAHTVGKRTIISPEVSRRANNKLLLHRFLEEREFPVFDTEVVERAADIPAAAAMLHKKGYREIVVKAQVGASGIGMQKLDASNPRIEDVGQQMFYEGPCLVQGWLDDDPAGDRLVGSPSMQMFLDETNVWLYDVTEQILSSESVHEGNFSPPPYWKTLPSVEEQMRDQAAAVGQWLHDEGYRGTASADFLVHKHQKHIVVRLCEVNARITGATYPSVLARHFCPSGPWLMRNMRFDPPITGRELLDTLRRKNRLFMHGSNAGVLPVNFNADRNALIYKGQFLCLGEDGAQCLEYLKHLSDVLPVASSYDRD